MASFENRTTSTGEKRIRAHVRVAGALRRSATFEKKGEARSWALKVESELRQGKLQLASAAEHHTAGELIDRYIADVLGTKTRKKRYIAQQKRQLLWWKAQIGQVRLSQLSQSLLAECRDRLARGKSAATVNRYLAALSHAFSIAVKEWEWLEASPLARLRKLKEGRGRVRFLSDAEREVLLAACARERKPIFLLAVLAISTGARKDELLSLRWQDVDLPRAIITLQETKNDERRALFLTGLALELMQRHARSRLPGCAFVFPARGGKAPMVIDREFARAVARAGIEDFHFHDLRHTCASYLAMNDASASEIAEVLGHKSLSMVKRYAHLSKTHTAGVVAAMTEKTFGEKT